MKRGQSEFKTIQTTPSSTCCRLLAFALLSPQSTGWFVVLGLTALCDGISVYIGSSPREGVRKEKG